AIIKAWLEAAGAETDPRKRGDYGGLALVFAGLADRRPGWEEALKEGNVTQSQQVLEWQAEAAARGGARGEGAGAARRRGRGEARGALRDRREALRTLLEDRFGALPEALLKKIESTDDLDRLKQVFQQALRLEQLTDLKL